MLSCLCRKSSCPYLVKWSLTRAAGLSVSSVAAPSASRMCAHTVSQFSHSTPCSKVVTIDTVVCVVELYYARHLLQVQPSSVSTVESQSSSCHLGSGCTLSG